MWTIRASILAGSVLLSTALAADTRTFIIDHSDGYGVDGCLAAGAPCGIQVATAWCHSHDYTRVLDFGRVAQAAAATPIAAHPPACTGAGCPAAVAITCER